MSILVTGATGTVDSLVTQGLADAGAQVKALVRQHGKRPFPAGVTEVVADLTDVASMRAALASVRTLFLLNAVTPDEVTQALIALNLAKEAGVERIVYLSVIHADTYTNVPHFTGKHTVERMIESLEIPATVLRPAYFMQNEGMVQQTITDYDVYPMPIGAQGIAMIDARDIADIAVVSIRRAEAGGFRWAQSQRLVGIAEIATEPDFLQRGCGRRGADVAIPGTQQRERGAGVRVVRLQRLQQRDQALRGQRDLIVLQLFRILQRWLGQLRKHLDDACMACVVGPLETEFALRNRIVAGQIHFVGRGDEAGFGILRPRQCGADTETAARHDPVPHRLARTLPTGGPGLCDAADPAEPSGRAPH